MDNEIKRHFQPQSGGENKTEIYSLMEQFKRATITHQNIDKWKAQIDIINRMINSQVENDFAPYVEHKKTAQSMKEEYKDSFKTDMVPVEMAKEMSGMHARARDIAGWLIIHTEIHNIVSEKIINALVEVKSLDIERDVLHRIDETMKQKDKLIYDVVANKMTQIDEKYIGTLKMMQEQSRIERNELMGIMREIITSVTQMPKLQKEVMIERTKKEQPIAAFDLTDMFEEYRDETETESRPQRMTKQKVMPNLVSKVESKDDGLDTPDDEVDDGSDIPTDDIDFSEIDKQMGIE